MAFKINLHITEKCNFRCKYCFAHFDKSQDLAVESWKSIVDNIRRSGLVNALNFAGGEPALYVGFSDLADYAHASGFQLSLISNGSLLKNPALIPPKLFRKLDILVISVDSVNPAILRELGCCDHAGKVVGYEQLKSILGYVREQNPGIHIKLNTVVNRIHLGETLTAMEHELSVDRWKFLRLKVFEKEGFSNRELQIQDHEFNAFVARNRRTQGETISEPDLTRSYIMVDNRGNLLDDKGESYSVVGNLLKEDFRSIFARYPFDEDAYHSRYVKAG